MQLPRLGVLVLGRAELGVQPSSELGGPLRRLDWPTPNYLVGFKLNYLLF